MPSTDSTPRIAASWLGTGISTSRSVGLRKNWSISFSASDSEARSSCTTLPMVWRSETRRYSSSIQASSGSGALPCAHRAEAVGQAAHALGLLRGGRSRRPRARPRGRAGWWPLPSPAARGGAAPLLASARRPCCSSAAKRLAGGNRRLSESPTSENCSDRPVRRCSSPPATADQDSLAAATRLRACAISAGSKRPSAADVVVDRRVLRQAVGLAHRGQARRACGRRRARRSGRRRTAGPARGARRPRSRRARARGTAPAGARPRAC